MQLLRELLIVAGQFRVNQSETRQFFYKTVRQSVNNFVAMTVAHGEEEEEREQHGSAHANVEANVSASIFYEDQLDVLRALASTGPGNIRAAENVAASVASALIRAAGERTVDLLHMHQTALEKR